MPRIASESSAGWAGSRAASAEARAPWRTAPAPDNTPRLPWGDSQQSDAPRHAPWTAPTPADPARSAPWAPSRQAAAPDARAPWFISRRSDAAHWLDAPAGTLVAIVTPSMVPWGTTRAADTRRRIAGAISPSQPADTGASAIWRAAKAGESLSWLPWGMGRRIDGGVIIVVEPPDPDDAGSAIRIPVLELYYVQNTVTLVRADTGAEIPAEGLQVGISRDGPHWTWSATIPGAARALVARDPDPVELLASLNGTTVHLVVERTRRDRSHGSDWLRVSGRSRSALLSAPYAATVARYNDAPRNAQQLADEALSIAGVPLGWALDWRVPDWLVPVGAWSHRGSHMEAVLRIAEAAGGYVQSHPSALSLLVLPHYPAAPWEWATTTPDIVIPEGVVEVEGTETADKPEYNAVYVEGQIGGRRDRVLRAGTAGDLVAPQIIDPLATDPAMTRARGLAVLADTGPQTTVSLRLPVLAETGLILPGKLIQYDAEGTQRRGITRAVQTDWRFPELWQTIEVEIHG